MDLITVFISTFLLVFVGELGDKTQIAAGTGTLANQKQVRTIFFSSALALMTVAGITVFGAGLIPETFVPVIKKVGGGLLALYGIYLFLKVNGTDEESEELEAKAGWGLFLSHFSVVFVAELGDKTQIATLAVAVQNQSNLFLVFTASSSALVTVTGLTVWGVTKLPRHWIKNVQRIGAALMVAYGIYMFL